MRLGPFYFDTKEIFLFLGAVLIALAMYFKWPLWYFEAEELLVLTVMFLILKGLLPSVHNEAFFMHSIVTIVLTLFFPMFHVILFYVITFVLLKLVKVI